MLMRAEYMLQGCSSGLRLEWFPWQPLARLLVLRRVAGVASNRKCTRVALKKLTRESY